MRKQQSGLKPVATSEKMIKVHRRNAVHAVTLKAKLNRIDEECRQKVNKISHEIFNIYFQEELPRERDILNRRLKKVPSLGSLMTLQSTGNEVFLYHTPRDRPMSRHPFLGRLAAKSTAFESSDLIDITQDVDRYIPEDDSVKPAQEAEQVKITPRKGNTPMPRKKPVPRFLPPMCRTYIDLLKLSRNKDRPNVTSEAQSDKLAKLNRVGRGTRFVEKLKKEYPDRATQLDEPTENKAEKSVKVTFPDSGNELVPTDNNADEDALKAAQHARDLVSVFLLRNKIINEGSDDGSSSSGSPDAQPGIERTNAKGSAEKDPLKKIIDVKKMFDPPAMIAQEEFPMRRKFSVPADLVQQTPTEEVDFKQTLLSFKKEALSKSKGPNKKAKKKRSKKS